jgi:SAM-dependent methyltransferase
LPSQRRLAKIYDKEYFRSYDPDDREHREVYLKRLEQYKLDAEYVSRYVKGGTVLDFGCGSGRYLEAMKGRLVKLGFEFNPSAVDRLKKARIDGFFTGDPFKMKVPGGLDLITLRGV